jgi:hypothetical protein
MAKKKPFRLGRGEVERSQETIVLRRRPLGAVRLIDGRMVKIPASEIPEPAPLFLQTESASREHARELFLHVVSNIEPLVLEDLRQLSNRIRNFQPISLEWELVNVDTRLALSRKGLKQWGERWHLTDRWCLDWASQTIGSWQQNPLSTSWFHSALVYQGNVDVLHFNFNYTAQPWNPFHETWEDYKKYVKSMANAVLEVQLEGHNPAPDLTACSPREAMRRKAEADKLRIPGYREKVERLTEQPGLEKTRTKREIAHFYWLAGYQVLGWSAARIVDALDEPGSRPTEKRRGVEQRIRELARQIDLKLREPRNYDPTQTLDIIRAFLKRVLPPGT